VQFGTENKTKTIIAAALGAIAVVYAAVTIFGGSKPSGGAPPTVVQATAPDTSVPAPTPALPRPAAGKGGHGTTAGTFSSLDPRLRLDILQQSEGTQYEGKGRNIFLAYEEPKIEAPIKTVQVEVPQGPPPPPPPPPITLKFFGFASKPGEPKKVFLSQGEDIFIAAEGDIVNRRYKVVRINAASAEIEDVLYNNRQSIPLTQN
jgi:hypothetical protein